MCHISFVTLDGKHIPPNILEPNVLAGTLYMCFDGVLPLSVFACSLPFPRLFYLLIITTYENQLLLYPI